MRMKLIVALLALCLTLSIVSVQAQDMLGDMEEIDTYMIGNVNETIVCNITGNMAMVEIEDDYNNDMNDMNNVTNDMNNITNDMNNVTNDMNNVTNDMNNVTEGTEYDISGRVYLIRDMGNMTERAVMIGTMNEIPGTVVIFGRTNNVTDDMNNVTDDMNNVTDDMNNVTNDMNNVTDDMNNVTDDMNNVTENVTIIMAGNMTGNVTFETIEEENGDNNMDNATLLMTGEMTGEITGEMTRQMVVLRGMNDVNEVRDALDNLTMDQAMDNMTMNQTMNNMMDMECDLTAQMVIIRGITEDETEENEDNVADLMAIMGGDTAIIGDIDDITEVDEDNMNEEVMREATGTLTIVRSMDDMIRIITRDITCEITTRTATVEMENMTENMNNTY